MAGYEIDWACTEDPGSSSINENQMNTWSIFPNPNTGEFTIVLADDHNVTQLDILNELGQVVYTNNQIILNQNISLDHVHSGIYLVRLTTENGYDYKKVIIAK
jgi:hypothetical protein